MLPHGWFLFHMNNTTLQYCRFVHSTGRKKKLKKNVFCKNLFVVTAYTFIYKQTVSTVTKKLCGWDERKKKWHRQAGRLTGDIFISFVLFYAEHNEEIYMQRNWKSNDVKMSDEELKNSFWTYFFNSKEQANVDSHF